VLRSHLDGMKQRYQMKLRNRGLLNCLNFGSLKNRGPHVSHHKIDV
jgi:hypothetical protein